MAWNDLLARLRSSADADMVRLADLLEMDLEGFSKMGPEGTAHGPHYGDHITTDVQHHFEPEIRRWLDRASTNIQDVVKELANFFGSTVQPSFHQPCNDRNKCAPGTFRALRYVTMSSFFKYFLKDEPTLSRIGDPKRVDEARKHLKRSIRRFEESKTRHSAPLANRTWNGRVWLTRNDDACPHEVARKRGLPEAQICDFVVQQMGLTGFHDPKARLENIGMVALEYNPNANLYRPTVLDAFPYLQYASVMAFYPAPKGKAHGETLPLDSSLSAPGARTSPGVPEWIHAVEEVFFRDVPPADLKDAWHCRVAWSGVW